MSRHTWTKLELHRYSCTRCGMEKRNVPTVEADGRPGWSVVFTRAGEQHTGRTPPCRGVLPAMTGAERPQERAWCASQWNAYVEAGASLQERRERLAEVPEALRDSVRAHVATVFQLREAARLRARAKQQRRERWSS